METRVGMVTRYGTHPTVAASLVSVRIPTSGGTPIQKRHEQNRGGCADTPIRLGRSRNSVSAAASVLA